MERVLVDLKFQSGESDRSLFVKSVGEDIIIVILIAIKDWFTDRDDGLRGSIVVTELPI